MAPEQRRPLIFDIHRYALDDGPGIRTTVFFKGCPLDCIWCHNPEGIDDNPELYHQSRHCIGCADCEAACSLGAVSFDGAVQIDREKCNGCGRCAAQCPTGAMAIKGRYHDPDELTNLLLEDKRFFDHSGGGVTLSGGEPTRHAEYLCRVIRGLKAAGVHVALQTCGHFQWRLFKYELLPWIDLIYFDIKCLAPDRHRQWTGLSNKTILNNFAKLVEAAPAKMICCIPLVSGLTADQTHLRTAADLIGGIDCLAYRLHPYHPGGKIKATALGKPVATGLPTQAMPPEEYRRIVAAFDSIVCHRRQRR